MDMNQRCRVVRLILHDTHERVLMSGVKLHKTPSQTGEGEAKVHVREGQQVTGTVAELFCTSVGHMAVRKRRISHLMPHRMRHDTQK